MLDVSGPADVFAEANVQAGRAAYRIIVLGAEGEPFNTLLIAGALHLDGRARDARLLGRVRGATGVARRFGSACTSAFLLAGADLPDGWRPTAHWAVAGAFRHRFPDVWLEVNAIHVRDGKTFRRTFQRRLGITPAAYRRAHRAAS